MKDKPRVMVIGLDGATFKNLKPWMEQGLLPNLKFLVNNGASGELESTIPYLSSPAWTSFMTGVNPGKHGVFAFIRPFKDKRYIKELSTSEDIKSKTIFELLSDSGKSSIVISLPMTYPPFKINGSMISCELTTPSTDFNFTYPEDLLDKIGLKKSDYILNINPVNYPEGEKEKFFTDLIKCAEQRKEISFKIMNIYDWDLFVLVFGGTDRLQHFYWHYIDPAHSKYNPEEAGRILPLIIKYYQKLDEIIGDFIKEMDKNTSLFIISDHGFGPFEKKVSFHKLLEQNGLLRYKDESFFKKIGKISCQVRGILHRHSSLYRKTKELIKTAYQKGQGDDFKKSAAKKKVENILGALNTDIMQKIDWNKTVAYCGHTDNTVLLNLKGREPEGILNSNGEYKEMRERIIDIVTNLLEHELNRKPKIKIYKKEELYKGPYSNNAYDLCFEIEDGAYVLTTGTFSKNIIEENKKAIGRHRKDGIIICYGSHFKKSQYIKDAQIIDLAPTILYLLKIAVPDYMDGKVIKSAVEADYLNQNSVNYKEAQDEVRDVAQRDDTYSKEDIDKVKKRLTDLGYI